MASSKPTQDIADWGSTGVIADSIPPFEVEKGQQPGKPVPAAWLNLFGAWLDFFRAGGGNIYHNPGAMGVGFQSGITVDRAIGGTTTLNNPSGLTKSAYLFGSPVNVPGTVSSLTIEFSSGTTPGPIFVEPFLSWINGAGAVRTARFAPANVTGPSVPTFAYTASGSDTDNIEGPWSLQIWASIPAGETLEFDPLMYVTLS